MQETTLYRISLLGGVIGILALSLISSFIDIEEKDISRITANDVDKDFKITGTVESIRESGGNLFLKIGHKSEIDVVLFKEENVFSIGDRVEVKGKITEYKDRFEIIGEDIRRVAETQ